MQERSAERLDHPLKTGLVWSGRILALGGIVFVLIRLQSYASQLNLARLSAADWIAFSGMAFIYGTANVALARAWMQILGTLGPSVQWAWALKVYGASQIAKYLPGNIFHLASRQVMGVAAGLPGKTLAKSALLEFLLVIPAGGLIGIFMVPAIYPGLSSANTVILYSALLSVLLLITYRLVGPKMAAALAWQSLFFIIAGMIFLGALIVVSHTVDLTLALIIPGAFVLAWLAGFLVPGAPAGLGVREVVLLLLLGHVVAEIDLLLAVLIGRMITVVGDVLFMLGTFPLTAKQARSIQ